MKTNRSTSRPVWFVQASLLTCSPDVKALAEVCLPKGPFFSVAQTLPAAPGGAQAWCTQYMRILHSQYHSAACWCTDVAASVCCLLQTLAAACCYQRFTAATHSCRRLPTSAVIHCCLGRRAVAGACRCCRLYLLPADAAEHCYYMTTTCTTTTTTTRHDGSRSRNTSV